MAKKSQPKKSEPKKSSSKSSKKSEKSIDKGDGQFAGKIALVTGAGTGLGEAIAEKLFELGATVVLAGRDLKDVRAVAERLDESGKRAFPVKMDVRKHKDVEKAVNEIVNRFGALHLAVNNAGITGAHDTNVPDYDVEMWNDVIATDLNGVFFGMKYEIPAIIESGGGAIVNMSSANGIVGVAGLSAYTAAKHAIVGLTRSAALEYADKGIRINAIGPGYVSTPRTREAPAALLKQMAESHPMKRLATRAEVAEVAAFLLSEKASFTTGSFYLSDGGYTAQ